MKSNLKEGFIKPFTVYTLLILGVASWFTYVMWEEANGDRPIYYSIMDFCLVFLPLTIVPYVFCKLVCWIYKGFKNKNSDENSYLL